MTPKIKGIIDLRNDKEQLLRKDVVKYLELKGYTSPKKSASSTLKTMVKKKYIRRLREGMYKVLVTDTKKHDPISKLKPNPIPEQTTIDL